MKGESFFDILLFSVHFIDNHHKIICLSFYTDGRFASKTKQYIMIWFINEYCPKIKRIQNAVLNANYYHYKFFLPNILAWYWNINNLCPEVVKADFTERPNINLILNIENL